MGNTATIIKAQLALTNKEIHIVCKAMPKFGTTNALCVYGYWNGEKCVGGSYLQENYPHNLVMEFYTDSPIILKAIWQSFVEMLKFKEQLSAIIHVSNRKSLKIAKMLGFKKVYVDNGDVLVQFKKEDWRYQKRYPIK